MNKNDLPVSELASAEYLLKRFEEDFRAVRNQMEILQIAFENLKGSWLAISMVHKVIQNK